MLKTRMPGRVARLGAALAAAACLSVPADALVINLVDLGGVTGSASERGFKTAAAYWSSVLTNDVTVNLGVSYAALADRVIGQTSSPKFSVAIAGVENFLAANAATSADASALDKNLVLPAYTGVTATALPTFGIVPTISMVRNGPLGVGKLTDAMVYDTDNTRDNATVSGTRANLKAIGYALPAATTDASVTFSTAFNFDFDPSDGIAAGTIDFIGVAIHEIGHALGFTSGTDTYDAYGPKGPNGAITTINWDNNTIGNVLDLFRYSNDPNDLAPGTGPVLDWSYGTASYFSVDGGKTAFNADAYMATGAYNGDSSQASHFKDTPSPAGCDGYVQEGIMDPTFCRGEMGVIKADDLGAMDAIGWNLTTGARDNLAYTINTAQIYATLSGVPEPATWATMLIGFGMVGASARRRRAVTLPA